MSDTLRFNPCETEQCKKRCDSYAVECEEICVEHIVKLEADLAASRTMCEELAEVADAMSTYAPSVQYSRWCDANARWQAMKEKK
jgi:hypothetical protein